MVIPNSHGDVAIQPFSCKQRRVTVDDGMMRRGEFDFFSQPGISRHHTGIVHHFSEADDTEMIVERIEIFRAQRRAGLIKSCSGNAGRKRQIHRSGETFTGFQHIFDAVGPAHIGDLMRIGNNGRCTVAHRRPGKFPRQEHGAFNMDMSVNQTGTNEFTADITNDIRFLIGIVSDTDDLIVFDQHIGPFRFAGKDIDHRAVYQ